MTISLILGATVVSADDIIMTCDRTPFTDETSYKFSEGWMFKKDKIYFRQNGEWLNWCERDTEEKEIKEEYGVCNQYRFHFPDGETMLCFESGSNDGLSPCVNTIDFIKKVYTLYMPNAKQQKKYVAKCR